MCANQSAILGKLTRPVLFQAGINQPVVPALASGNIPSPCRKTATNCDENGRRDGKGTFKRSGPENIQEKEDGLPP